MPTKSLTNLLEIVAPREQWGANTLSRYDFQINYSILMLFELAAETQDYSIAFDLYDDIVVLDSLIAPSIIKLYQVKSKDPGHWTCSDICKKVGNSKPKYISSRMYHHIDTFKESVGETALVSNAAYVFLRSDGSKTSGDHHRICGTELHSKEITKLKQAIKSEFPNVDILGWLPKLFFIRTPLGVHGQRSTVIGCIEDYLDKVGGSADIKSSSLYDTLHASIVHKSKYVGQDSSAIEKIRRKSITRTEFDQFIQRARRRGRSVLENWGLIDAELAAAGEGSADLIRLKTAAVRYTTSVMLADPKPANSLMRRRVGHW